MTTITKTKSPKQSIVLTDYLASSTATIVDEMLDTALFGHAMTRPDTAHQAEVREHLIDASCHLADADIPAALASLLLALSAEEPAGDFTIPPECAAAAAAHRLLTLAMGSK